MPYTFTPPPPPPPPPPAPPLPPSPPQQLPPGYWVPGGGNLPPKKPLSGGHIALLIITASLVVFHGARFWSLADGSPDMFALHCGLWVAVIIGWFVVGDKRYPGLIRAVLRATGAFLAGYAIGSVIRRSLDNHHHHDDQQSW